MRTAIIGGRLASEDGSAPGTLILEDGRISAVLSPAAALPAVEEQIDATGLTVLPGAIDLHTHLGDLDQADRETFATGTRAAICGGVTTAFEHPLSDPPTITAARYAEKLALADGLVACDLGFWGALTDESLGEMAGQAALGAVGFKAFTCASGGSYPAVDLATLEEGMRIAAGLGALVLVHCEDGDQVAAGALELSSGGPLTAARFAASRPPSAELAATQAVLAIAERTGCRVQIVHVSVAGAVDAILSARARGVAVTFEHTPHHLLLDSGASEALGALAHCAPPVRAREEVDGLWARLRAGAPAIAASDHGPYVAAEKRGDGTGDLRAVPLGLQGVQETPALILDACVHGAQIFGADLAGAGETGAGAGLRAAPLGLGRAVQMLCAEPARAVGLWPCRGSLGAGADADLVLWDLDSPRQLDARAQQRGMHRWSPHDGRTVRATPRRVLLRGQTVAIDGDVVGRPAGRALPPSRVTA